jgi:hypothetical protein
LRWGDFKGGLNEQSTDAAHMRLTRGDVNRVLHEPSNECGADATISATSIVRAGIERERILREIERLLRLRLAAWDF